MRMKEVAEITNARVVCGSEYLNDEARFAFSSDLMSDILTLDTENLLIITGLMNMQLLRTAEMVDVKFIVIGRGKKATPEMIELAKENKMVILESPFSLFRISGELNKAGMQPVY